MDPNETLARIRQLIDTEFRDVENSPAVSRPRLAELTEHFRALDDWLSRGGFPPEAWGRPETDDEYALRIMTGDPLGPPDPAGVHMPEHHDA